jgi:fructokinase
MIYNNLFEVKKKDPICLGTGLVALDIVINNNDTQNSRIWAGGSCGNVLTILAYLGWRSYPIARLADEFPTKNLLFDLERWKVNLSLIFKEADGSTPIIVERINKNQNGEPKHKYEWHCPKCGSRLPSFRPILVNKTEEIIKKSPKAQVFFFDRLSRSSIILAKENKLKGALIMFEPSSISNEKLFFEALELIDIIKYSKDRLSNIEEITNSFCIPLEIQTLGSEGLRYKFRNGLHQVPWKTMPAYAVSNLKDAAGSGDWCSAGILHVLGQFGKPKFEAVEVEEIENAIRFGQALASINCRYEGARGGMYNISKKYFEVEVINTLNCLNRQILPQEASNIELYRNSTNFCPKC